MAGNMNYTLSVINGLLDNLFLRRFNHLNELTITLKKDIDLVDNNFFMVEDLGELNLVEQGPLSLSGKVILKPGASILFGDLQKDFPFSILKNTGNKAEKLNLLWVGSSKIWDVTPVKQVEMITSISSLASAPLITIEITMSNLHDYSWSMYRISGGKILIGEYYTPSDITNIVTTKVSGVITLNPTKFNSTTDYQHKVNIKINGVQKTLVKTQSLLNGEVVEFDFDYLISDMSRTSPEPIIEIINYDSAQISECSVSGIIYTEQKGLLKV